MQLPLDITFRRWPGSPELGDLIRAEAAKLERYFSPLVSCRVMVERPQRAETGAMCHVRLDVVASQAELVVDHDAGLHGTAKRLAAEKSRAEADAVALHKRASLAIREAFREMRRQLQDHARKLRGDVKSKSAAGVRGRVVRLFPDDGYGFIETFDGRKVYFHSNSVSEGRFDRLRVGTGVTFIESQGEQGPQASTVRIGAPRRQAREAARSVAM